MDRATRDRAIHWTATGPVSAVMAFSAVNFDLEHPFGPFDDPFAHLGLPDYLRVELTVAKALGLVVTAAGWSGSRSAVPAGRRATE